MAKRQQVAAIDPQFFRQMERRNALAEAPQDHDEPSRRVTRSLKRCAREHVEHLAAGPTPVVHDGLTVAIVGRLIGGQFVPLGAVQTLGMKGREQQSVACCLVQQIVDREEHGDPPVATPGALGKGASPPTSHEPRIQCLSACMHRTSGRRRPSTPASWRAAPLRSTHSAPPLPTLPPALPTLPALTPRTARPHLHAATHRCALPVARSHRRPPPPPPRPHAPPLRARSLPTRPARATAP
jgi:hypothetical protein